MITEQNLYIGKVDDIIRVVKQIDDNTFRIMGSLVNYNSNEVEIIEPLFISERQENTEHSDSTEQKALHIADVSKQRELLIAFASHLNTYKGMEEIRFDFMVIDFLEKQKGN